MIQQLSISLPFASVSGQEKVAVEMEMEMEVEVEVVVEVTKVRHEERDKQGKDKNVIRFLGLAKPQGP